MLFSNQAKYALSRFISIEVTNQTVLNKSILANQTFKLTKRTMVSSDFNKFRETLRNAKHVVALTGAGISAESGVIISN